MAFDTKSSLRLHLDNERHPSNFGQPFELFIIHSLIVRVLERRR